MMDSKTKKKGYIGFSLTGILAMLFTYAFFVAQSVRTFSRRRKIQYT